MRIQHIEPDMGPPSQIRQQRQKKTRLLGVVLTPIFGILFLVWRLARILRLEPHIVQWFLTKQRNKLDQVESTAFEGYTPSSKDVLVCSYVKSGTNWAMQMVWEIANKGQGSFEHVHDVVPWPDANHDYYSVSLQHPLASNTTSGHQVIKTHAIASYVPYNEDAIYLCIAREPSAVLISAYFFVKDLFLGYLMPPLEVWLEIVVGRTYIMRWCEHIHGYWAWRDRPNVLFVRYESMKEDLRSVILQMAEKMQVQLTPEEVEAIEYKCSFAYMKSINHKFFPGKVTPLTSEKGELIRKGQSKNNQLSPAIRAAIRQQAVACFEALDSDVPFEEWYG